MKLSQDIIDNMNSGRFDESLMENPLMKFVDMDIHELNETDMDILYSGRRDDMTIVDILDFVYND